MAFYHSRVKPFFGVISPLLFVGFGGLMVYVAYIEENIVYIALSLFIIVLFSFFTVANLLKMIRGYPYIMITDDYIQLDSFTKSEATIYFTDIKYLKVSETSFQPIVEIVLNDEDDYFAQLSFHNKVRLCMNRVFKFSLFTMSAKVVRKQERAALLETLDLIMQQKLNNEVSIIKAAQEQTIETDFMEKYDPTPPINRTIDRSYFLKSYGYSFILFAISFILFYLLISKNNDYLFYIIVSFILYPFARVLIDWLFGFKLRYSLKKQKGFTYYFEQLKYMLDFILFHVSLFVAPIGLVFLLIRFIVNRMKR